MLPISVDLARLRVLLAGNGAAVRRRLARLDEAGAARLDVYAPNAGPDLAAAAGARLHRRLPAAAEVARAQLVFVCGLDAAATAAIRHAANAAGVLVNVEDDRARSDFHSAAVIRRGDLMVAVSTHGQSPGLAALLREMLEQRLGPEWGARLDRLAALRRHWRAAGAEPDAVARRTRDWAIGEGWLEPEPPAPSQPAMRPIG
jgi:precorrin-2 dehydrogenase/sirohydrochlorin ferrochelatase